MKKKSKLMKRSKSRKADHEHGENDKPLMGKPEIGQVIIGVLVHLFATICDAGIAKGKEVSVVSPTVIVIEVETEYESSH